MSWSNDIDKKLAELMDSMQNKTSVLPPTQSKNKYELAAEMLEEHAITNTYRGALLTSGDNFAGWPIFKLLELIPKADQALVHAEIKRRNIHAMPHNGSGAAAAANVHTHSINIGNFPQQGGRATRQYSLEAMMAMRMRWQEGALRPEGFAHMAMHQAGDNVHIWIITKDGQSVVLEDEIGLYPSDALITKIRLMQRGETS